MVTPHLAADPAGRCGILSWTPFDDDDYLEGVGFFPGHDDDDDDGDDEPGP